MNTINSSPLPNHSPTGVDNSANGIAGNMSWGGLGLKIWDKTQSLVSNSGQWSLDNIRGEGKTGPLFALRASIKNEGQSTNLQVISSESQSRILLNPDGSIELGHSWSQQIFDVFQQSLTKMDSLIADAIQRLSDSWASISSPTDAMAEPSITTPSAGSTQVETSKNLSETTSGKLPNLKKPRDMPKMGDFLWKPVADKDGKLVVLLPSKLTGDVNRVRLLSPDGKQVIAQSRFSGIGNGNRGHYRFPKPGAEYPANTKVEVIMDNGTRYRVNIPSTGKRMTR